MKTIDYYKNEILKLGNKEYEVIDILEQNKRKVLKIIHHSCNKEFIMTYGDFKKGRRCPHCFGKHKKTQEEFEKEIKDLVGDEYSVIGKYIKYDNKIKFYHTKCKKEFEMKPANFIGNRQRCPFCNSNFYKITFENVKKEFYDRNLELLETSYKNSKEKLKYKCLKCGCEHSITYMDFKYKKHGCPSCSGNKKLTFEEIKENIENVSGYKVISKKDSFKNVHSKLELLHSCGLIYTNSYNNFRNGQRCPLCEKKNKSSGLSKAVRKIIEYCINNKIKFKREIQFKDLIGNKKLLRIDFYLPDLDVYIEYNGRQHYFYSKNSKIFNEESFKKIVESDNKKKEYMEKNNLNFEIIKYSDDPIEKLKEIILKYKKI